MKGPCTDVLPKQELESGRFNILKRVLSPTVKTALANVIIVERGVQEFTNK